MAIEHTLAVIKPDAVLRDIIGAICALIEGASLRIIASKMLCMQRSDAEQFYAAHRQRSFFLPLVEYMSSGPILVMVLEGDNAVDRYRQVLGATHPERAAQGTIRQLYGVHDPDSRVLRNAAHGSDNRSTAQWEINFFFSATELFPRAGRHD